jgi:hypothetical protein
MGVERADLPEHKFELCPKFIEFAPNQHMSLITATCTR